MKLALPIIALAAAVLAGCNGGGGGFSTRGAEKSANVFRYPVPEMTVLDPAKVQDGDTMDALQQVYEGLTTWSEDNQVVPGLAESWTLSEDGRTYTFKLRRGVKFHNGREMTADDVKWSLERVADPKTQSPTVGTYLFDIVGVRDKFEGRASEVEGVKVLDPYTVAITIDKPRPYFLGRLTYMASHVIAKEAVGDGDIKTVDQMVGTGPFKAEKWVPNEIFTMVANDGYWDGRPSIDKIERPIIKDAITRLNKFKNGELDLTRVERQDIAGIQEDPKLKDQLKFYDRPSLYYVGMDVQIFPPFRDKRVRQAFAMAIDREAIVRDVLGGINKVANSIVPPGVQGYRESAKALPFDLARARRLLAEAGYPGGRNFPKLTINHRDGQTDVVRVAEAVATQLRQNLGIQCNTGPLPWTTYLDLHNKGKLNIFHMRWAADYLDPENFLSTLLASYGNENKIHYKNPQYDALCAKADAMVTNHEERMRLYAQAEDMVIEDAPFIPIYFQRDAELISPRVQGMRESLFGHLPHTKVKLGN